MVQLKKLVLISLLFLNHSVFAAGKFDIMGGFYSLKAQANNKSGSLTGPGSYMATYSYHFISHLDFTVSYSLFFSGVVTGDMGFGPDLGFTYFPFSSSAPINFKGEFESVNYRDSLRPFVNVSFNQRQFQSVDSAYAGFSGSIGTEYYWNSLFDLKGLFRYQMLNGPEKSTGSYFDFLLGVTLSI